MFKDRPSCTLEMSGIQIYSMGSFELTTRLKPKHTLFSLLAPFDLAAFCVHTIFQLCLHQPPFSTTAIRNLFQCLVIYDKVYFSGKGEIARNEVEIRTHTHTPRCIHQLRNVEKKAAQNQTRENRSKRKIYFGCRKFRKPFVVRAACAQIAHKTKNS